MSGSVSNNVPTFRLDNKVAVVTGAAGILGQQYARALAAYGASVALIDVNPPQQIAQEISEAYKIKCGAFACDLRAHQDIESLPSRVSAELGPCSILVNNAATKGSSLEDFFASDAEFSPDLWREIMSVNLDAMFFVSRAFKSDLGRNGEGTIIQIGSIYGLVGPDQRIYEGSEYLGHTISSPAVYSASKAGVIGLTKHLAADWARDGIRVNCVVPGGVDSGQNTVFQEKYSARVPMGRMASADDMNGAVVFLASTASKYVNGQVITIDGGLTAW